MPEECLYEKEVLTPASEIKCASEMYKCWNREIDRIEQGRGVHKKLEITINYGIYLDTTTF